MCRAGLFILLVIVGAPPTLLGAEPADLPNTSPRVVEQNGVSFTSGGAGRDEAQAMKGVQDHYNLQVTMATNTGQFTSPSEVRIEDRSGRALVSTRPDGPIFFAKVPPGEYTVSATAEGRTQTRKVNVPASGAAPVTFTWPMSGGPDS